MSETAESKAVAAMTLRMELTSPDVRAVIVEVRWEGDPRAATPVHLARGLACAMSNLWETAREFGVAGGITAEWIDDADGNPDGCCHRCGSTFIDSRGICEVCAAMTPRMELTSPDARSFLELEGDLP